MLSSLPRRRSIHLRAAGFAAAIAALGFAACSLDVTGLPLETTGTAGAPPSTTTSSSTTGAGGGSGGSTSSSTSTSAVTSSSGSTSAGTGGDMPCAAGFDCVAELPGALSRLGPDGMACPMGFGPAQQVGDGNDPGCNDCSCGPDQGGKCKPGDVAGWAYHDCTNTKFTYTGLTDGQCVDVTTSATAPHSFKAKASTAMQGSCAPVGGGTKTLPASTLCPITSAPAKTECAPGRVCVPTAPPAFSLCYVPPMGANCLSGFMSVSVQPVTSDDRKCPCDCGAPTGESCGAGFIRLHNDDACTSATIVDFPDDDPTCHGESMSQGMALKAISIHAGAYTAGMCGVTSKTMGSVKFGAAKMICCPE